jgi:hypothetical protein
MSYQTSSIRGHTLSGAHPVSIDDFDIYELIGSDASDLEQVDSEPESTKRLLSCLAYIVSGLLARHLAAVAELVGDPQRAPTGLHRETYTIKQAADATGASVSSLRREIALGHLRTYRATNGKTAPHLITRAELTRWVEEVAACRQQHAAAASNLRSERTGGGHVR